MHCSSKAQYILWSNAEADPSDHLLHSCLAWWALNIIFIFPVWGLSWCSSRVGTRTWPGRMTRTTRSSASGTPSPPSSPRPPSPSSSLPSWPEWWMAEVTAATDIKCDDKRDNYFNGIWNIAPWKSCKIFSVINFTVINWKIKSEGLLLMFVFIYTQI